jgi:hypothetical protein
MGYSDPPGLNILIQDILFEKSPWHPPPMALAVTLPIHASAAVPCTRYQLFLSILASFIAHEK